MPNGADQIYGIIEDETEFAQEFEARGNYKAAKKTWEHVLELWQQVLDHHDATTGCGQESIRKIAEIRMRLVRLAKRASMPEETIKKGQSVMSELTERAYKFRRFDRDCTCQGLLRELADRIGHLEEELRKAQEAHCLTAGEAAKAWGAWAAERADVEKTAHEMTSAMRHVQTELGNALGALQQAKKISDVALGDKKG